MSPHSYIRVRSQVTEASALKQDASAYYGGISYRLDIILAFSRTCACPYYHTPASFA
jgi:hypothetical protein